MGEGEGGRVGGRVIQRVRGERGREREKEEIPSRSVYMFSTRGREEEEPSWKLIQLRNTYACRSLRSLSFSFASTNKNDVSFSLRYSFLFSCKH